MISIPSAQTRQWSQPNSGESLGTLFSTRNINFDQLGYLKLAHRSTALFQDVASFDAVTSISYLTGGGASTGYYVMTSGHPFYCQTTGTAPTDMQGSGHSGNVNYDGLVWQGRWYISQSSNFSYYDGSWTTGLGSFGNNSPHPLCVFESLNYLACGDLNQVKLYNTSHVLQTTLTIPANFEIRWIRYLNNNIYVGTRNVYGGDAELFVWDGTGSAAQGSFPIKGNWMFSGENFDSSIAIITSRGQLLKFNGGGFDSLANLPVYYTPFPWYGGVGFTAGKVAQRGMVADGDTLNIALDGTVLGIDNTYLPNQPSGLWVYDKNIGLYHKAGNAYSKFVATSFTPVAATDICTITSNTAPTGTKFFYSGSSGGLIDKNYYWTIRLSATTIKVASSYANAIAGTAIDITSVGGFDNIYFQEITDFGATYEGSIQMGAVAIVSDLDLNPLTNGEMGATQILWGANNVYKPDGSGDVGTLQCLTRGENRGNFVTQKISTYKLLDAWQKIYARFNLLYQANDKIAMKYRINNRENFPIRSFVASGGGAQWTSSTTFTTSKDLTNVRTGDEVELISGAASGCCLHVASTPTYNAGTGLWTVTVTEAAWVAASGDDSSFSIDNWTYLGTGTYTDLQNFVELAIPQKASRATWIQLKGVLQGNQVLFENLNVVNVTDKPAS